ncbi:hypothetical protein [Roseibium sp. Sym1]|uniref:hypothetical protein n=1 Tax=Roseibium sp. Sym1 TaxID=3016006 RepID=UPI0022B45445|nr:hypothetical protein [Roseibium sp. Sym1]
MPLLPLPVAVDNLMETIGTAADGLIGDTAAFAQDASDVFAGAVQSSAAEWQTFIEGLTDTQADVMARLVEYMARLAVLSTQLGTVRNALASGTQPAGMSPPQLVRSSVELIEVGASLLAEMRDAFGPDGIDAAIRDASPFLARKMRLPDH